VGVGEGVGDEKSVRRRGAERNEQEGKKSFRQDHRMDKMIDFNPA
jgi:hypothetical protein